jgi:hypothetical protein
MQIFVKLITGKTIALDVEETDLIVILKQKIQDQDGIRNPSNLQRLIFGGTQLDDDNGTLHDNNIKDGSILRERMPGFCYPSIIFDGTPAEDVMCGLCTLVTKNPHQCSEGDLFCQECVTEWVREHNQCPTCACELTETRISNNETVDKMIKGMPCMCEWREEGCAWTGTLRELDQHVEKDCVETFDRCPNTGCGTFVRRKGMSDHDGGCDHKVITCGVKHETACDEMVKRGVESEHEMECSLMPIKCEHCAECPPRGVMAQHLSVCLEYPLACPYAGMGCSHPILGPCSGLVPRGELSNHVKDPERMAAVMGNLVRKSAEDTMKIAALEGENADLRSQLDTHNRKLITYRTNLSTHGAKLNTHDTTLDTLGTMVEMCGYVLTVPEAQQAMQKAVLELRQCAAEGWLIGDPGELLMRQLKTDGEWRRFYIVWRGRDSRFSGDTFIVESPRKDLKEGVQGSMCIVRTANKPDKTSCFVWLYGYRGICDFTLTMLPHRGDAAQVCGGVLCDVAAGALLT